MANKQNKWKKQIGVFHTVGGAPLAGELTFARHKTTLQLHSLDFFHVRDSDLGIIQGSLNDLSKVTLLGCISSGTGTKRNSVGDSMHFAAVFPHYVTKGDGFLDPTQENVLEADFILDDNNTLFYDFDAFGRVINSRPLIADVVAANASVRGREVELGDNPQIAYFTGKHTIINCETPFGEVSAYHSFSMSSGGPGGVGFRNQVRLRIKFMVAIAFETAIDRVYLLRNYLGLLVGRPQKLNELAILLQHDSIPPARLDVYWSWAPRRKGKSAFAKPHPGDILIDPIRDSVSFRRVLANWLEHHEAKSDSRARFFASFAEQRHYSVERLVAAANAFDLLPASAIPKEVQQSSELIAAKGQAKALFHKLPESPQRDSILQALGRIGKSNLKQKVGHRAEIIMRHLPADFPDFTLIAHQAVDYRNYFVHGSYKKFDYKKYPDSLNFFTDTLEFILGASDLIESGWDIGEWRRRASVTHPFRAYQDAYDHHLNAIRRLLESAKTPE